jgi:hypothetical protein
VKTIMATESTEEHGKINCFFPPLDPRDRVTRDGNSCG